MDTDLKSRVAGLVRQALASLGPDAANASIVLERPRQAEHGEFATNVAMQLARVLKRNPREIAAAVVAALPASPEVAKAEVAGGGFINFHLRPAARFAVVSQVLAQGESYGRSRLGAGARIQVEFVSANPTGPLHVGHGRGAAYGASLANLLEVAGYGVQREFYINDAGRQMDILALSAWLRYLQFGGKAVEFPENGYQGEYVKVRAAELRELFADRLERAPAEVLAGVPQPRGGESEKELERLAEDRLDALIASARRLLGADFERLFEHVLARQLDEVRDVLERFGVRFDRWYSERSLHTGGAVAAMVERLTAAGKIYLKDGAQWFRSTEHGDEKDRVVRRENGLYTYFASDIAYHDDKFARGFEQVIDVWGADHHGYIPRVKAALAALGRDPQRLTVPLIQLVSLFRGSEPVRMGKRSGNYVTLEELFEEVGVDATRYFYLARKCDQSLDFDLDLAKSQSLDNPVYYIQYAHARIASVLDQWGGDPAHLPAADLGLLSAAQEAALAQRLAHYPETIENAARDLAPHVVAFYLKDLAAEFHSYYNAVPFLVEDAGVKHARLALICAVRQVLRNGLRLLGVSTPEKM